MDPAKKEGMLREGIQRFAHESAGSPIFHGMTQEQREERIKRAVRAGERVNPRSTDPE